MSTTLPHVKEDLAEAEAQLATAQEVLIEALASRSHKTSELGALEAAVAEATHKRNDLRTTRDFIIQRERERGDAATGQFQSVLYISQRVPSVTMEDVAALTGNAQAKNEGCGVTGVLYVFREWFASYLEGSPRELDKLIKKIAVDNRHRLFRIVARDIYGGTGKRLFPRDSLKVKWCIDGAVQGGEPWTAVMRYMETQLDFTHFEPQEPIIARGVGARSGRWFLLKVMPSARYKDHLARFDRDPAEVIKSLSAVRGAVRSVIDRMPGASTMTPHSDGITCAVPASVSSDAVVMMTLQLREAIVAVEPAYFPHIAVLLTTDPADAVCNVDGLTNAVGPALRRLRILTSVGSQEDRPVVLDTLAAAEMLDKSLCVSLGWFEFDGAPTEVHIPSAFGAASPLATWGAFIDHQLRGRIKAGKKRASVTGGSSVGRMSYSTNTLGGERSGMYSANEAALQRSGSQMLVPKTVDPDSIMTAERYCHLPVAGAITEAEIRAEYIKAGPRPSDDTIAVASLQKALYDIDFMGAPPPVHELRQTLKDLGAPMGGEEANPEDERVTFDQFAVLWCRSILR
jgi:hypothetical protein